MKKLFLTTSFFLATSLLGYEACGSNEKEALANLSSAILSNVTNDFTQSVSATRTEESEDIEQKIDSIMNVKSNLSLVNIKFTPKEKEVCASVSPQEQLENTQLHLQSALALEEANLPNEINEKIKKLKLWIEQIEQANNLVTAFLKPSLGAKQTLKEIEEITAQLQKKEKRFHDLYNEGILQADALVFKSCAATKEKAYTSLNEMLFKSKTKQKDDEGILSKTTSFLTNFFTKNENLMLDLFEKRVSYTKSAKQECAYVKKEELFALAGQLHQEVLRFSPASLSKDPKERFHQIKDFEEHLNVTKALLEVFPERFAANDFSKITAVKKELASILENTHPQSVTFRIAGDAQEVKIKIDDKFVDKNIKHYLKEGTYAYTISAKEKCPFKGEFTLEHLEDRTIDKDFSTMNFPLINFYTKENTRIVVDGKNIRPNVETTLNKCEGEVRYIANYADQEKSDTLTLEPNFSKTIELRFLTPQELSILSDAKTKHFKTASGVAFSESLTPISNKNIRFSLENDCDNGDLELHESGSFTYKSKKDFIGLDSFTYTVTINDETSAPKVVNITIVPANIPVAPIAKQEDQNQTQAQTKIEEEEKKEVSQETSKEQEEEERYQKFKKYVESQEQNVEKLQKLQKSYPKMFERLLQEKLATGGM
ncbi:MAG: Ig-like domain-containing protein [Thiovulaceae bacterium]|nr:Ig-like domain-containing protein [Sulfurimonadaceae bacterium]